MDIAELSDIQSESGVIGTLLYHPEYIAHTEYLKPNDFYNQENACMYWAIQELYKAGITNIDAYNLSSIIQSNPGAKNTLEKFNLPSVTEWVELYKSTARNTLEEYKNLANNILTNAFKRDLIKSLDKAESYCYRKDAKLDDLSNMVYTDLDKLTKRYMVSSDIDTLGSKIDKIWEEIVNSRAENGYYGIPSKYPSFSEFFTYEPGELVVIQAKYKQGKSVFLMNEVVHKLKNGVPVLVYDSEMTTKLYTERLLSHITGVEIRRIKSGNYSEQEAEKIKSGIAWIKKQPLVHIYEPGLSMQSLFSICKTLQYKMNLGFVVYDYLKSNETQTSENYNVLGAKCDYLKNNIAGELEIPVLAACQLNRNGEVADSIKINRYLSVGIKWGYKSPEMMAKDGMECGNAYAKIYINRLGPQMQEDDDQDYIDFVFSGDTMTIVEAEQHERNDDY